MQCNMLTCMHKPCCTPRSSWWGMWGSRSAIPYSAAAVCGALHLQCSTPTRLLRTAGAGIVAPRSASPVSLPCLTCRSTPLPLRPTPRTWLTTRYSRAPALLRALLGAAVPASRGGRSCGSDLFRWRRDRRRGVAPSAARCAARRSACTAPLLFGPSPCPASSPAPPPLTT